MRLFPSMRLRTPSPYQTYLSFYHGAIKKQIQAGANTQRVFSKYEGRARRNYGNSSNELSEKQTDYAILLSMERLDDLQHNGLMLYQDTELERFTVDALWLCSFLRAGARDNVVELGPAAGLSAYSARTTPARASRAVERQPGLVDARAKERVVEPSGYPVLCADVAQAPDLLGRGTFTSAVMNPPYFTSGR
jgi:hypothetical protein